MRPRHECLPFGGPHRHGINYTTRTVRKAPDRAKIPQEKKYPYRLNRPTSQRLSTRGTGRQESRKKGTPCGRRDAHDANRKEVQLMEPRHECPTSDGPIATAFSITVSTPRKAPARTEPNKEKKHPSQPNNPTSPRLPTRWTGRGSI